MRRLVALALCIAVGACGSPQPPDSADVRRRAQDFASSADRALVGTRFEGVALGSIATAIEALCGSSAPFDTAVFATIAGWDAPDGPAADDQVAVEVLVAGVVEVCPERVGDDAVLERFVSAVREAVEPDTVDELAVTEAGLLVCDRLDAGAGGEGAVLVAAETLFGVVAPSFDELGEAGLDAEDAAVVGATVAAAVEYLCPVYRPSVMEFLEGLSG